MKTATTRPGDGGATPRFSVWGCSRARHRATQKIRTARAEKAKGASKTKVASWANSTNDRKRTNPSIASLT